MTPISPCCELFEPRMTGNGEIPRAETNSYYPSVPSVSYGTNAPGMRAVKSLVCPKFWPCHLFRFPAHFRKWVVSSHSRIRLIFIGIRRKEYEWRERREIVCQCVFHVFIGLISSAKFIDVFILSRICGVEGTKFTPDCLAPGKRHITRIFLEPPPRVLLNMLPTYFFK